MYGVGKMAAGLVVSIGKVAELVVVERLAHVSAD